MSFLSLFALACALAMDAFAVAIAVGIALKKVSSRQTFRLAWHFGLFQALMPIVGWLGGSSVSGMMGDLTATYDHWIAFALLAIIGGNMIREAFMGREDRVEKDATRGWSLVMLSVATSIDALAVGFSMSLLKTPIVFPAVAIGVVAAGFTAAGLHLGRLVAGGKGLGRYAEIIGGLVLWIIAINILHEHGTL